MYLASTFLPFREDPCLGRADLLCFAQQRPRQALPFLVPLHVFLLVKNYKNNKPDANCISAKATVPE